MNKWEQRKGATKQADIQPEVLDLLNKGMLESVNLTEWLAVDQAILCKHVFEQLNVPHYIHPCTERLGSLKKPSAMQSISAIAETLLTASKGKEDEQLIEQLTSHKSDNARCWATYMIGLNNELNAEHKISRIKPFAADRNFGVREVAWMAIRSTVIDHLDWCIDLLSAWTKDENGNVRRFASEATRPRGVWCKHIEELKQHPEKALSILEPLKADPEKYVQDSVANWLNDAGKTQPTWVVDLCNRWLSESAAPATQKIVKRALRTINKVL